MPPRVKNSSHPAVKLEQGTNESVRSYDFLRLHSFIPSFLQPVQNKESTIRAGGVENAGNTCTLSVLLQEFFAFADFYNPILTCVLRRGEQETDTHFEMRVLLQSHLIACMHALKDCHTVTYQMAAELSSLLLNLGWQEDKMSFFRKYFYQASPYLFPLPVSSPHQLFRFVLSLMSEAEASTHKIVLLTKAPHDSFKDAILQSPLIHDTNPNILWRIAKDRADETPLDDGFCIGERIFTLSMVLACRETLYSNHVVAYRKMEAEWVLCDDAKVVMIKEVPAYSVYEVIFSSCVN